MTYATEDLLEEVAYLAAVFHWPLDDVLDLEHPDRRRFIGHARVFLGEDDAASPDPRAAR